MGVPVLLGYVSDCSIREFQILDVVGKTESKWGAIAQYFSIADHAISVSLVFVM